VRSEWLACKLCNNFFWNRIVYDGGHCERVMKIECNESHMRAITFSVNIYAPKPLLTPVSTNRHIQGDSDIYRVIQTYTGWFRHILENQNQWRIGWIDPTKKHNKIYQILKIKMVRPCRKDAKGKRSHKNL